MLTIIDDGSCLTKKTLVKNLNGESPNHHGRIGTRLWWNSDKVIQEQTARRLTLLQLYPASAAHTVLRATYKNRQPDDWLCCSSILHQQHTQCLERPRFMKIMLTMYKFWPLFTITLRAFCRKPKLSPNSQTRKLTMLKGIVVKNETQSQTSTSRIDYGGKICTILCEDGKLHKCSKHEWFCLHLHFEWQQEPNSWVIITAMKVSF